MFNFTYLAKTLYTRLRDMHQERLIMVGYFLNTPNQCCQNRDPP